MATTAIMPIAERGTAPAVRACYDLMTVATACEITDFTDGKYIDDQNDRAGYLAAQERQAEYLLDQARCGPGTQLLDIGCGYGRILEHAARRGAEAVGITISPPQVTCCRARGLVVHELNYRNVFDDVGRTNLSLELTDKFVCPSPSWEHGFDAIVANGSLEHFVQATDAATGRVDEIYEEMFKICRRLIVASGRFVTTTIHFSKVEQFDPAAIARGPSAHRRGSAEFHYAMLVNIFGGWYPEPGRLVRCAAGHFELVDEEDGTHDYHLTSEYWFRQFRQRFFIDPRVWWSVSRQMWQRPAAAWRMLQLQIWDQSWAWQFRPPAPMRLLRQTWLAK